MIKMDIIERDKDGVPILYDRDIRDYALLVLKEYDPERIKTPGKLNYERFFESYLGAKLTYQYLYSEYADFPTFGAAVFNAGRIAVFNKEQMCVDYIPVEQNTVLLDCVLLEEAKAGLALFTAFHEAGHLLLHVPAVQPRFGSQMTFIDDAPRAPIICCRRNTKTGDIQSLDRQRSRGAAWLEHQADFFSASILMPDTTFRDFVREKMNKYGFTGSNIVVKDYNSDAAYFSYKYLPQLISDTYGVSRTAAKVKLQKDKFIVNETRGRIEQLRFTNIFAV